MASTPPGPEPSQPLGDVELPSAPPIIRATARPIRRPKIPAAALLALGALLTLGPIIGGMFAKAAAGQQMIDRFAPHMDAGVLARYGTDLAILRRGSVAIDAVYSNHAIRAGTFPGIDAYRREAGAIESRSASLLDRVSAAQPDYREVAAVGGFDRIPFLMVASGIVAIYGGLVLLTGRRTRGRGAAALVVFASAALAIYPFPSGLDRGAAAGQRMLHTFTPIMTPPEVRQLQKDFVVLVTAVGEMDTGFRPLSASTSAGTDVDAVVTGWPTISSDLASLVGVINDDIGNFHALAQLDRWPRRVGLPGLEAFPWILVGIGTLCAGLAFGAWPRRRRGEQ